MSQYLVVGLDPVIERTLVFDTWTVSAVNRAREVRVDASGRAVNTARVLAQLGEPVVHLCHLGGRWKELFTSACYNANIVLETVATEAEVRAGLTVVDGKTHTTTGFIAPADWVDSTVEEAVLTRYERLLSKVHTVTLAGNAAPGYSDTLLARMVALARRAGVFVVVSCNGRQLEQAVTEKPDLIRLNSEEFARTFLSAVAGSLKMTQDSAEMTQRSREHMQKLAREGIRTVITCGPGPALWADTNGDQGDVPAIGLTPVNLSGSGDAFTGGLVAALNRGDPLAGAVEYGHTCAAMNAAQLQPGSVRPER